MPRLDFPPRVELGGRVVRLWCPRQSLLRVPRLFLRRFFQRSDRRRRHRSRRRRHAELGDVFGVRAREPRLPATLGRLRQRHDVRDVTPPVESLRHVVHGGGAELRRRRHRFPAAVRLRALHDGAAQRRELDVDDGGLRAGFHRSWVAPVAHDSLHRIALRVVVAALALGAGEVHAHEGGFATHADAVDDARGQRQRAVRPRRSAAIVFRRGVHLGRSRRALLTNRVQHVQHFAR
mmetsp:Transcript_8851/g.37460  ORF Transcript_8851/g.37460 Transcript_8851/m.37460 type:complete len:235 (+) Transcript_8851:899-1603(+)